MCDVWTKGKEKLDELVGRLKARKTTGTVCVCVFVCVLCVCVWSGVCIQCGIYKKISFIYRFILAHFTLEAL
jgi:hypothetical protein